MIKIMIKKIIKKLLKTINFCFAIHNPFRRVALKYFKFKLTNIENFTSIKI